MNVPLPARPEKVISRLINYLLPYAKVLNLPPRKKINMNNNEEAHLYIFLEGEVSLLRASDGLIMLNFRKPHLFGVACFFQPLGHHSLRLEVNSKILRIEASKAKAIISNEDLWEDAAELLSYNLAVLSYRDSVISQRRSCLVVRKLILEMMQLPESERERITVLKYIQERTHLSRSSILNELYDLNKKGCIEYSHGGFLKRINVLPTELINLSIESL